MVYPKSLLNLIENLKKLPGIGERSAERMALSLLEFTQDDIESFSNSMLLAKNKIQKCKICGCLTDEEICDICNDASRDNNVICILEDFKGVFAFEKSGKFFGKYHVLNGLISPIDGIEPEDLNISSLINRIEELSDPEIIIALKPSIEGETTTLYLKSILKNKNVKITRLSYGIPVGIDIDYLDELTLFNALKDRKDIS